MSRICRRIDCFDTWFIAIGIVGAVLQPFLLNFYASGAVEEKWTVKNLRQNRIVAGLGMSFGAVIGIGILVLGALVLGTRGGASGRK